VSYGTLRVEAGDLAGDRSVWCAACATAAEEGSRSSASTSAYKTRGRVWPLHGSVTTNIGLTRLNGNTGGAGGNHILRNIDCTTQRGGGAIKKVMNARNSID